MSEITKEKRDRLRKHASEWVEMGDVCHIKPETMLGLLDALERADARADGGLMKLKRANALTEKKEARVKLLEKELDGADAEIASLRDELEDSRGTGKDAPSVLCAIARIVGVYEHSQETGDDMGQMTLDEVQNLISDKQKAEAEVARLTERVNELLAEELTDGAVRERIQLRHNMHEVLQENERLTKERDWLAGRCAMHCHDKDRDDILCSDDACDISSLTCVGASACDWKEAARRAVAGEGK